MPQLPAQTLPSVAPAGAPGVFQTTNADPSAFGGQTAQGLAKVGAAGDQLGDVLAENRIRFQVIQNKTNTSDVYTNQFSPPFRDLYQRFYSLQGKDAVDQMPDYIRQMEDLRTSVRDSLPNDTQKIMFDDESRRRVEMELDGMARYADQQNKVWRHETYQSTLKEYRNQAADKANDEHAFGTSLGSGGAVIDHYAMDTGKSAEWARAERSDFVSAASVDRLESWMLHDPLAAQKWYQENTYMVDAAARPVIEHRLKAAVLPVEAKTAAANIMQGANLQGFQNALSIGGEPAINAVAAEPTNSDLIAQAKVATRRLAAAHDRLDTANAYSEALANPNTSPQDLDDLHTKAVNAEETALALEPEAPSNQPSVDQPTGNAKDTRAQLGSLMANADRVAEQLHPGDPVFRDLLIAQVHGYVNTIVAAQEGIARQAHMNIMRAAMGEPGGPKPMTVDDLLTTDDARRAWVLTDPQAQRGILALLDHNAREARGEFTRSNPAVVSSLFNQVHLPEDDPNKIRSATQLAPYFAQGLNRTDYDWLKKEIDADQTPEGNVFLRDVQKVRQAGHTMITKSMLGGVQPDIAEEAAYRFSFDLQQKIDRYRAEGKDPRSLITPGSSDYVLTPERVSSFMADPRAVVHDQAAKVRGQSGAPAEVALPKVANDDDFAKLKPGTVFIAPDGTKRRKP